MNYANVVAEQNTLNTKEIIDHIFKDPSTAYELTEFENLGKPVHEIVSIYPKTTSTGRDAGKVKYFLKCFIPFSSGNEEVQVFVEGGKSAPEEIIRQLWVYKLTNQYGYKSDEIDLEAGVQFGVEVGTKAADIIVYTDNAKDTPKIIVECKKPKREDGIEQLKSYMNAKGAPVAVWSNGSDSIILYRPYPKNFDDTLFDIPKRGQEPKDVLEAKKTLLQLKRDFNFKKIIQDLEELVLADSGKDEFNEIFKLIFAKIWDEKEALENRKDKTVEFSKALDPDITFDRINGLFKKACEEWPGIFKDNEDIELAKRHLQVCVGPIEGVRLMGSNLRIMDDAFEYLLPTEAKKKKGQFFTPRHVVEMCVRMLNPTQKEYVMDSSCGSGGFLLHAMEWCYPADDNDKRELRKHKYAARYLWGIDFKARAAKTSRALMLIAGDGHTNIFGPDVSSLDPRTWYENSSGQALMHGLRQAKLTAAKIPEQETLKDDDRAWEYFDELKFDVVLANPPFAGEMKDRKMLARYELAKPALKRAGSDKAAKEERDVLFIERILKMLRPGGRAAIVLPQGKFNNSSLAFIREWILKKARLLAVVGLHPNTFKPHTGTKTSVLFIQKYTDEQLADIARVHDDVAKDCPAYETEIQALLDAHEGEVPEDVIPDAVADLISETFSEPEPDDPAAEDGEGEDGEEAPEPPSEEDRIAAAEDKVDTLKSELVGMRYRLVYQVVCCAAGAIGSDIWRLRRSRLLGGDDERLSVLGDAENGVKQFAHGGDERELGRLAGLAQAIVEGLEPRIDAYGGQHGHPERAAQLRVAEGCGGTGGCTLSRLPEAGNDTDIGSEGAGASKGALTEAIRAGYAKRAGSSSPYPDFQDILEIAVAAYEEDGKKDDSLIEVLRDLSDFDLFWKHGSESPQLRGIPIAR